MVGNRARFLLSVAICFLLPILAREVRRWVGQPTIYFGMAGQVKIRSGAHPNAVLGTLLSIPPWRDFGIPVFLCSDRQAACRFVEGFLHRYHRKG